MKIIVITAAIAIFVLLLIGYFLFELFGPVGIIAPAVLIGTVSYFVYRVGFVKILVVISLIIFVRKIVGLIIDMAGRRKIERSYHSFGYREPAGYVNRRDIPGYELVRRSTEPKTVQKQIDHQGRVDQQKERKHKQGIKTNNCPNCGAVMVMDTCPYCNTKVIL